MDKGVTVTTEDGRTVITIKGASDLGKTYTVVLESMDKKLADWQNKLQNITREDAADVEVMIKELQNLDTENLNEEQKSLIDSLLETAGSKLVLINSVNEVMAPISKVDEVTFENADAVEEYLKKYGELTEAGCESYETSEDGLTWTFHLRDNKYSDGEEVKAQDYVNSIRRIFDPEVNCHTPVFSTASQVVRHSTPVLVQKKT